MKKVKKNIFITGGLGQDGKILSYLLNPDKYNIFIFAKRKTRNILKNCKIFYGNLKNKKKISHHFKKNKPDIVLHIAANNPSFKEKSYNLFYKENLLTTKNIFDETFKANINAKFIFFNSSQIFKKKNGKVTEKSKFLGKTDYTKFRIDSHKYMINKKRVKNLFYTNLILFNHDSKFRNHKFLIPRVINALRKKNLFFLKNIMKENIYADFSHAEDICRGIIKLISTKKNLDNLIFSSNKATSLNKIIYFIIKKNKLEINLKTNKYKKNNFLIGNNSLAKNLFRWRPKKNIFIAANEIYKN